MQGVLGSAIQAVCLACVHALPADCSDNPATQPDNAVLWDCANKTANGGNAPLLAALATQAQTSHPPVPLAAGAQPVADRAWPEVRHHLRCFVCGLLWFVALVVSLICLVDDFWLTNLHHEPRSHWLLSGGPFGWLFLYGCIGTACS